MLRNLEVDGRGKDIVNVNRLNWIFDCIWILIITRWPSVMIHHLGYFAFVGEHNLRLVNLLHRETTVLRSSSEQTTTSRVNVMQLLRCFIWNISKLLADLLYLKQTIHLTTLPGLWNITSFNCQLRKQILLAGKNWIELFV